MGVSPNLLKKKNEIIDGAISDLEYIYSDRTRNNNIYVCSGAMNVYARRGYPHISNFRRHAQCNNNNKECIVCDCREKRAGYLYFTSKKTNYSRYSNISTYHKRYIPYCINCFKLKGLSPQGELH